MDSQLTPEQLAADEQTIAELRAEFAGWLDAGLVLDERDET